MTHEQAVAFIRDAVPNTGGTWADFGTGKGAFAFALADLLGSTGEVYALDQQGPILTYPAHANQERFAPIIPMQADFTQPIALPALDGIVIANSLHYVAQPEKVLPLLLAHLNLNGSFLLIEYDTQTGNTWVPYPIDFSTWQHMAPRLGLSLPHKINRRKSIYGNGQLYAALSVYKGL